MSITYSYQQEIVNPSFNLLENLFFGSYAKVCRIYSGNWGYDMPEIHLNAETPKEIGFLIEKYVIANFACPICGGSLYAYQDINMPIVDAICLNRQAHTRDDASSQLECFLFQIKSSISWHYKPLKTGLIIPKTTYTKAVHSFQADDSVMKKLTPGYIFIASTNRKDYLEIDIHDSFFMIPRLTDATCQNTYYELQENAPSNTYYLKPVMDNVDVRYFSQLDLAPELLMVPKNFTFYVGPSQRPSDIYRERRANAW